MCSRTGGIAYELPTNALYVEDGSRRQRATDDRSGNEGPDVKWLIAVREWWSRTYGDEVQRQRRMVEEDARRLHGKVEWLD